LLERTEETKKIHNEETEYTKTNEAHSSKKFNQTELFFVRLRYLRSFVVGLLRSLRELR